MTGADPAAIFGWGLRRYAALLAVFVVAGGILVPWLLTRGPAQYDAQAQVGPTAPLTFNNLDPLPVLGQSVFTNGAVAATIRSSANPPLPSSANVIPQRVELVTSQDNVVFVVVGHGATARQAARYANIAAATFTNELNKYAHSVGPFAVQKHATPPATPAAALGRGAAATAGVLAGLVAGVGVVVLLLTVRRPVLSPAAAFDATGAAGFGRLVLARSGKGVRGLPQLVRNVRENPSEALLVVGPRRVGAERRTLVAELSAILGPEGMTVIDQPSAAQMAARPESSLVLLVVPEGIAYASLRRQAEQYLDGHNCGVLLVRGHSRQFPQRLFPEQLRRTSSAAVGSTTS